MKRRFIRVNGVQLHYVDFGGEGPTVLLLHGLMGRATTWIETARSLQPNYHVVALDQRGHGLSDKVDNAYSREDYTNDIIRFIEQFSLQPVILIGHSMGALNAWTAAARRPDLVSGLILEDMTAETSKQPNQKQWKKWFDSWPVPFPSLQEVRDFFYRQRPTHADYFMEIMTEDAEGYRPLFDFEHLLQSVGGWETRNYWSELESVQCPTLVIRGGNSDMPAEELIEMADRLPFGRYVEIPGAAHVVHYDQPGAWQAAIQSFLKELGKHS